MAKILYFICICCFVLHSCKMMSNRRIARHDKLQRSITRVNFVVVPELLNIQNFTKVYQSEKFAKLMKEWNWYAVFEANEYPRPSLFPYPDKGVYKSEEKVPAFFYDWLIHQDAINHRMRDSLRCLRRGETLLEEDYSSFIKSLRERMQIYFVGNIKSKANYCTALLLSEQTFSDVPFFFIRELFQLNYRQDGTIISLIKVGGIMSGGGDLILEWTWKENDVYYLLQEDIILDMYFPNKVLKEMRKLGEALEGGFDYVPFSIDSETGYAKPEFSKRLCF